MQKQWNLQAFLISNSMNALFMRGTILHLKNKRYPSNTLQSRYVNSPRKSPNKIYHPVKTPRNVTTKDQHKISFCIICMNRIDQLKQTLLQNILDNQGYDNLEFIILDYNSQDKMQAWFKKEMIKYINSGRMVYYKTIQPKAFHHSHAKNLAFKLASGDIVCNINADHFTGKEFADFVNQQFNLDANIVITPINRYASDFATPSKDVLGKVAVRKIDFLNIRGFDERMQTYGFEDFDFINRLEMTGIKRVLLKERHYLQYISHENEERFSLEDVYSNLDKILVRYITPSSSELIFMYQNGNFEIGEIIDNATSDSDDPKYSYQKRQFEFEYAIKNVNWIKGSWFSENNSTTLHFTPFKGLQFHLLLEENHYKTATADSNGIYYELKDLKSKKELLGFHYLLKNRSLLETNSLEKEACPNVGGFGEATVYRNFNTNIPIVIT